MNTRSILLLIGLSLMALIINIDYTAVNLALISIAKDLHTNLNVIQWVLGGYVLAWAAAVIPASKCSSVFGQRTVCVFSLAVFALSSLTAGLATNAWMLILSRVVQGLSGALFIPTLYAMLYSYFPEEKRGFAIGIFSLGVGTGAAIGPTFGGLLLTHLGWSWIFYINLPITALSIGLIMSATDPDTPSHPNETLITPNAFLLASGLVGLMYAISLLNHPAAQRLPLFAAIVMTAVCFIGFWRKEKASAAPLIPWALFKNKPYLGSTFGIGLEQFVFAASFVSVGLYLQNSVHYSITQASLVFLALSIIFAVISTMGGMIVDKIGMRKPATLGFLVMGIGCLCFTALTDTSSLTQLVGVLFLLGIGMGLAFAALNTGVITTVNAEEVNIASSVFLMFALVGNSLGIIVSTSLYQTLGLWSAFDVAGAVSLLGMVVVSRLLRRQEFDELNLNNGQKVSS